MISSTNNGVSSYFGFSKQPKKLAIKNLKLTPAGSPSSTQEYEEASWSRLSQAITCIYSQQPIGQSSEELYQICQNLCLFSLGNRLYSRVALEIDRHIQRLQASINQSCKTLYPLAFLVSFAESWTVLCGNTKLIQRLFLFLDKSYVLETAGVLSLWSYTMQQFKETVIEACISEEIKKKLISSLLECIENERKGAEVNRRLMGQVSGILLELGLYDELFEKLFLQATESFYSSIFAQKYATVHISAYLAFVSERIAEESCRIDECFALKTKKPTLCILERYGLRENMENILREGIPTLFDSMNVESFRELYSLFERIHGLDAMKTVYCEVLKARGACIVAKCATTETSGEDSGSVISELVAFKRKTSRLLSEAFKNNDAFSNSTKDAFEDFINMQQNKPAELLAKYFDSTLKNAASALMEQTLSADSTGKEVDDLIGELMHLFRYIHGKDIFEAFYKKDLAKRLLLQKNFPEDLEKSVLLKLKAECGPGFTSKLEGMFKDMTLSREFSRSFCDSPDYAAAIQQMPFDFNAQVLTSGFWPNYPDSKVKLPEDAERARELFKQYYQSMFNGRQLTWQNSLSSCVIKATFPKGTKELLVSTHQAAVLFLFNQTDTLSYAQILEATEMNETDLQRTLLSLSCSKVRILTKEPKTGEISPKDEFTYNKDFVAKLFRLKINTIQLKEPAAAEESTAITAKVLEDRQIQIDAAIVRIMKTKRVLSHNVLVAELLNELKFPIKTVDLKKRIESLIEREYLERDKEMASSYIYLA